MFGLFVFLHFLDDAWIWGATRQTIALLLWVFQILFWFSFINLNSTFFYCFGLIYAELIIQCTLNPTSSINRNVRVPSSLFWTFCAVFCLYPWRALSVWTIARSTPVLEVRQYFQFCWSWCGSCIGMPDVLCGRISGRRLVISASWRRCWLGPWLAGFWPCELIDTAISSFY